MADSIQLYTPDMAVLEITSSCNLKCIHCYSSSGKPKQNQLTTEEWFNVCNDLAKINSKEVCLIGGEPFLHKDWESIANKVKDLSMELSLISNGFSIGDEIVSKLVGLEPCEISLSLDGATSKTHDFIRGGNGSFKKVLESISSLTNNDIQVSIITTVNKINFKELSAMADLLIGKKVKWNIQASAPVGRFSKKYALTKEDFYAMGLFILSARKRYSTDELPVIAAQCVGYNSHFVQKSLFPYEWDGCLGGRKFISIQSDGGVKGCLSLPDDYIEGNIRQRSLIDIWNDQNSFAYSRKFKREDLGQNCKGCRYDEKCKGGCPTMSIGYTGKLHNDPFCFYQIEQQYLI